jgi:GDP-4-dehydro-6-deoxy-D-mannose reductase
VKDDVVDTVTLCEAIVASGQRPRLLLTSSSAVYGRTPPDVAVRETMRPRPLTQYGASKLAQEVVLSRYARAHGLPVVRARAFNLLGPGMSTDLACGRFVAAIVDAERDPGAPGVITTGSLDSARDFTDVRDVVRAYALLAEKGLPGRVYNVCSGHAVTLRTCLEVLLGLAGRPLAHALEPGLVQQNDLSAQVGDGRRLATLTAWRPEIAIEQSLADMLAARRET